jgi:FlaA1/EpsC-like NDP-sugar epimerase
MIYILKKLHNGQKVFTAIFYDFVMAMLSFYMALVLRFGVWKPSIVDRPHFIYLILLVTVTQSISFYMFGLYKGVWRYASTPDLVRIIKSTILAILGSYLALFIYIRLESIPRSLFFINWLLLVMSLGGGRLVYRMMRDHYQSNRATSGGRKNVIIVGAGAGGEQLFREIKKNNLLGVKVIGFIDDSRDLMNRSIHGVPVLGTIRNLPTILENNDAQQVFIAIPSASSKLVRSIYEIVKPFNLEIKILPRMSDILDSQIQLSKLQNIKIEDLLGREEVKLSQETLKEMLENKIVLVTGAGGSIGSELCQQLVLFKPSKLIAIDVSEFNIYSLEQSIRSNFPDLNFYPIVGDVRDQDLMDSLFSRERPQVVLHAAAYKHVPLMEFNPYECIRTNVLGTKTVSELCIKYKIERFVLISTDKAVNPTNVMGTSKRIAEIVVQSMKPLANGSKTKLMTVRFGNVLGSSGSVIPLFRKQIENGGPITVTHKDITRYFMSIPEASKLVLQAGAMGTGGELFVLDMGEPIKIINLAKEMIALAGFQENVDIDIQFTGLRPGEKLYEEPLLDLEAALTTHHQKVKISEARPVQSNFEAQLELLLCLTCKSTRNEFIFVMKDIVPEYKPFEVESPNENAEGSVH